MEIEYSEAFYNNLNSIMEKTYERGFVKCRGCGQIDGAPRFTKKGEKSKLKGIVRLALIDENGKANDPNNVGYYCTVCRKGPKETKQRIKASKLPQLFP